MKKLLTIVLVLMAIGLIAQSLGSRYLWTNKIAVSSSHVDSTFSKRWEYVTIYSDTLDLWLKIGAPDTSGWSSRDAIMLKAGTSITFEQPAYLKRLEMWTVSGSGYAYLVGIKTSKQH